MVYLNNAKQSRDTVSNNESLQGDCFTRDKQQKNTRNKSNKRYVRPLCRKFEDCFQKH